MALVPAVSWRPKTCEGRGLTKDQLAAITGANKTNPRPFILTTSTALLWDNDGTLYKAYIGARRNFWYDGKM